MTAVTTPTTQGGTAAINPDNTVTYTPPAGFIGGDSFGYTISDGFGGTANANVSITVRGRRVGYYDLTLNGGSPKQVAPITTAGLQAINVGSLTTADLSQVDVLFVQNPDNFGYSAAFTNNLAKVHQFVANGGVLIFHDRHVGSEGVGGPTAASILPGAPGEIHRDFVDDANINIVDGTTLVTNGPGGTLNDTSLDGGTSSSHGWILASSIPVGAHGILSRSDPTHLVLYSYSFGLGKVVYSTIPLDYYLAGFGPAGVSANMRKYGANVVAYGNNLR